MITYLVDSREQKPYAFKGCDVETIALKTGDYSVKILGMNYNTEIAIERKSLQDMIGSITQGRERFEKEMVRSLEIPHFYLIIEGSWDDIYSHNYISQIPPNSVINTILGWQIKYGYHIIIADNHRRAEDFTKRILNLFAKYKTTDTKKKEKMDCNESNLIADFI